ncbi:hypothetical protein SapgrDRAFT_2426 [Saprospira grandis DSM 2844]|uniref:Lipoprotein n=1 Tax=Saprospira grandis DSM 2844 TaxID=694433 RepID=J0XY74_9BACT|nr:hypothetical protein [Saprospira grandis]EJF54086.1 hypothetical protein SapgrDRAFT_2426 [Saprospira grandis DSM 2844]
MRLFFFLKMLLLAAVLIGGCLAKPLDREDESQKGLDDSLAVLARKQRKIEEAKAFYLKDLLLGDDLNEKDIASLFKKVRSGPISDSLKNKILPGRKGNLSLKGMWPLETGKPEPILASFEYWEEEPYTEMYCLLTYKKNGRLIDCLAAKHFKEVGVLDTYYSYINYGSTEIYVHIMDSTKESERPTPDDAIKKDIWVVSDEGKFELKEVHYIYSKLSKQYYGLIRRLW